MSVLIFLQPWDALFLTAIFDHSKYVKDMIKSGIDVYMSQGTMEEIGINTGHRLHKIESLKPLSINGWKVFPFDAVHDSKEPLNFHISKGKERILFITDTSFVKYVFPRTTRMMVECNYSESILDENIRSGRISSARRKRLVDSHFSLERLVEFLKANDISRLQQIFLLHLSRDNSDEKLFKRTIQQLTGIPVIICVE